MDKYMDDADGRERRRLTPSLPIPAKGDLRHTLDGYPFNIHETRWRIPGEGKTHSFIFDTVSHFCAPTLESSIREGLADLLQAAAPGTVRASLHAVNRLLKYCEREAQDQLKLKDITGELLENYFLAEGVGADRSLRPLLETFNIWKRPGLSACGWDAIKDRSFKTHIAYIDVLTLDPEFGPYVDSELAALDNALQNAYETGRIGAEKYLTVMIFNLFGQRPATNAKLKIRDVRTPKHHRADCATIRFPIVKQRRKGRLKKRNHGMPRTLPMFFSRVLETYLDERFHGVSQPDCESLPLFRAESPEYRLGRQVIGQTAKGYAGHPNADTLNVRYQRIIRSLEIISPRTGSHLKATPNRARHTVGTQMAMQGAPAAAIAAWLEHQSELSCEAYVTVATQHFQLMSSLLDGRLSHLAGRFLGEIISQDAVDEVDLTGIIFDVEDNCAPSLGACAEGGCAAVESLDAPYACFTCPNFNLSLSADLRPLLVRLKERHQLAAGRGDSMMLRQIERTVAAVRVAHEAQETRRG